MAQRVLKFLVHLKNGPEFAIFPNLLKTYSKVVKAQNKCVFHHLGGTLAWKTGLHLFWHQKSNFLALEMLVIIGNLWPYLVIFRNELVIIFWKILHYSGANICPLQFNAHRPDFCRWLFHHFWYMRPWRLSMRLTKIRKKWPNSNNRSCHSVYSIPCNNRHMTEPYDIPRRPCFPFVRLTS